jgi:hypothetical protein
VVIERQTTAGWARVANLALAEAGTFVASLPGARGSYRARVLPSRGYVEAVTAPLAVEP